MISKYRIILRKLTILLAMSFDTSKVLVRYITKHIADIFKTPLFKTLLKCFSSIPIN